MAQQRPPDIDLSTSRDASVLVTAAIRFLASSREFFAANPEWRARITHAERVAIHENLLDSQACIARLREVLVVLPPFDSEQDWRDVERAARKLDGRLGGVAL